MTTCSARLWLWVGSLRVLARKNRALGRDKSHFRAGGHLHQAACLLSARLAGLRGWNRVSQQVSKRSWGQRGDRDLPCSRALKAIGRPWSLWPSTLNEAGAKCRLNSFLGSTSCLLFLSTFQLLALISSPEKDFPQHPMQLTFQLALYPFTLMWIFDVYCQLKLLDVKVSSFSASFVYGFHSLEWKS